MEQAIIWAVAWTAIGVVGWVLLYFIGVGLAIFAAKLLGERVSFEATAGLVFVGAAAGWIAGLCLAAFSLVQVIINIVTAIQIGTN